MGTLHIYIREAQQKDHTMMKMNVVPVALIFTLMQLAVPAHGQTITTQSLLQEMIDLGHLAEFPEPSYKNVQFSSYDRRSRFPSSPGWFANDDGFGGEPVPGFEKVLDEPDSDGIGRYLICDEKGPGAIVRLWTAAIEGQIRLFLDGADTPVYEGPAEPFFKTTYEAITGEDGPYEDTYSQASAGYFPIPFAKQCRIEWTGDLKELHFYQVQLRLYESGAKVTPFSPNDVSKYSGDIEKVAKMLANTEKLWRPTASVRHEIVSHLPPGETKEVLHLEVALEPALPGDPSEHLGVRGTKAIEQLTLKVQAPDVNKALRQTLLNIHFDGDTYGQVQAPLGDFFGAAPGINPYDSLPFTVLPDGTMICRFLMPFRESARVVIDNRGSQSVTVTGSVNVKDHRWKEDSTMHFRARWRMDHDLVASGENPQDLPFVLANGKGVFVGATSLLLNPTSVPSSWGNWWGEGDEKIFVDDDETPSIFGTGSEDYYNYAWSSSRIFAHAYCGQPRNDGPANRGFVTNYRWQIIDPIPFHRRLGFYMELFSHEPVPDFSYARLAYYYGLPTINDDHVLIKDRDVRPLSLPETWHPIGRKYTEKAVFYQAEAHVVREPREPAVSLRKGALWAGGRMLVWHPAGAGDELTLQVPVEKTGEFTIVITAARFPDAGAFSARLGDTTLTFGDSETVDLAVPYRTLSRNFRSQMVALDRGVHTLSLRCEGEGSKDVGLDFIWLVPKRE